MATPGRKPKPASQRIREGNAGHRPVRPGLQTTGVPEKPDYLSEMAAAEWDRTVPDLVRNGVATRAHTASLTAMCVAWGVAEQARAVYEAEGLVEEGSMGQMVEHPMVAAHQKAIALYLRIATEFGLTASAAMRIEVAHGAPEPFEAIGPSPRLRRVK